MDIAYEEQRKMLDELKHIDDLSNTLKAVETAIGFLSTHGGTPNQKYDEYLDTKLRYNPKHYLASKTVNMLCTNYARNLWVFHYFRLLKALTTIRLWGEYRSNLQLKQNMFESKYIYFVILHILFTIYSIFFSISPFYLDEEITSIDSLMFSMVDVDRRACHSNS